MDEGIPVYPPLCEWGYNKSDYHDISNICIKLITVLDGTPCLQPPVTKDNIYSTSKMV
jgi:hypothetical protein